jgi:membrane protease subunit HflC
MRKLLLIAAVVLLGVLARMSFFTVDPTEFVYVTQLGEHVATYDGADMEKGAGLHWRWPWPIQSIQRLDRRLQYFDLPVIELLTRDTERQRIGKTLVAETYACWRIPDETAVDRFIRRIGTPERARTILGQRINSQLGAATGQIRLEDLISTQPGHAEAKMEELRRRLMDMLKDQARQEYGIELVDVRLRRFNHPASVRDDIFARIRSERKKMAEEIRSQGVTQARNIKSEAEEKAQAIRAQALFEKEKLKGEADNQAAMIRNQAHSQDPEFYVFLKKMEQLQSILGDNKTVLLLSTHRNWFDLLFQPPQPGGVNPAPASNTMPGKAARRQTPAGPEEKKGGQ